MSWAAESLDSMSLRRVIRSAVVSRRAALVDGGRSGMSRESGRREPGYPGAGKEKTLTAAPAPSRLSDLLRFSIVSSIQF